MLMPVALTACADATADLTQAARAVALGRAFPVFFGSSTSSGSVAIAYLAPSLAAFATRAGSWSPNTATVWMRSHGYDSHGPYPLPPR